MKRVRWARSMRSAEGDQIGSMEVIDSAQEGVRLKSDPQEKCVGQALA
jgi:hypothetical protein